MEKIPKPATGPCPGKEWGLRILATESADRNYGKVSVCAFLFVAGGWYEDKDSDISLMFIVATSV